MRRFLTSWGRWAARINRPALWLALGGWAAGLFLTAGVVHYWLAVSVADQGHEFAFDCREIRTRIQDRLAIHEQLLRSAAAFMEQGGNESRQAWHHFIERQEIETTLPGIQAMGFGQRIAGADRARHEAAIQAENAAPYHVRPAGEREFYGPVVYIEPFNQRNLRAFGYDMLSEPVRREAMLRAGRENRPVLTGQVRLVQETEVDVQPGAIMYLPVYRRSQPLATPEQRERALVGWVYSAYRMNNLLRGILGGWDTSGAKQIHLEIYDGPQISPGNLIFGQPLEPHSPEARPAQAPLIESISVAGHDWTLRFIRTGSPIWTRNKEAWVAGICGFWISTLVAGLGYVLVTRRKLALQQAQQLTHELEGSTTANARLLKSVLKINGSKDLDSALATLMAEALEISSQVAATLNEIVAKVRQVDELAAEVAGASREQTQGITQINAAIAKMDNVIQSNAANAEETAGAAEELNGQADAMKESVESLIRLVGSQLPPNPAVSRTGTAVNPAPQRRAMALVARNGKVGPTASRSECSQETPCAKPKSAAIPPGFDLDTGR